MLSLSTFSILIRNAAELTNGPELPPRCGGTGTLRQRAATASLFGARKLIAKLAVSAAPRALNLPAAGSSVQKNSLRELSERLGGANGRHKPQSSLLRDYLVQETLRDDRCQCFGDRRGFLVHGQTL